MTFEQFQKTRELLTLDHPHHGEIDVYEYNVDLSLMARDFQRQQTMFFILLLMKMSVPHVMSCPWIGLILRVMIWVSWRSGSMTFRLLRGLYNDDKSFY